MKKTEDTALNVHAPSPRFANPCFCCKLGVKNAGVCTPSPRINRTIPNRFKRADRDRELAFPAQRPLTFAVPVPTVQQGWEMRGRLKCQVNGLNVQAGFLQVDALMHASVGVFIARHDAPCRSALFLLDILASPSLRCQSCGTNRVSWCSTETPPPLRGGGSLGCPKVEWS